MSACFLDSELSTCCSNCRFSIKLSCDYNQYTKVIPVSNYLKDYALFMKPFKFLYIYVMC